MQALVCLAELEGLHIQQSESAFDKCNKEGLVRGLWRNHKHERKVRVAVFVFFIWRVEDVLPSATFKKKKHYTPKSCDYRFLW